MFVPGITNQLQAHNPREREKFLEAKKAAEEAAAKREKDPEVRWARMCQASPNLFAVLAEQNKDYEGPHRPVIVSVDDSKPGSVVFDIYPDAVQKSVPKDGALVVSLDPVDAVAVDPNLLLSLRRNESEQEVFQLKEKGGHAPRLRVTYDTAKGVASVEGNSALQGELGVEASKKVFEILAQVCTKDNPNASVAFKFETIEKVDSALLAQGFVAYAAGAASAGKSFSLTLPDNAQQSGPFISALAQICRESPDLAKKIEGALTNPNHKTAFGELFDKAVADAAAAEKKASANPAAPDPAGQAQALRQLLQQPQGTGAQPFPGRQN